jgi:hypothetical protein
MTPPMIHLLLYNLYTSQFQLEDLKACTFGFLFT